MPSRSLSADWSWRETRLGYDGVGDMLRREVGDARECFPGAYKLRQEVLGKDWRKRGTMEELLDRPFVRESHIVSERETNGLLMRIATSNGFGPYVMASYFEKHGCLLDSTFQEFIADKLRSDSCQLPPDRQNLPPRVSSILRRQLIGEGAHRHLTSTIKLNSLPEPSSQLSSCSSKVIVLERLPSGIFADPFELQHPLERGAFAAVSVMGDTNLELPAFLSNRSLVEIHVDIDPKLLSGQSNEQEISINLPLHARYPPLDESGYHEVRFSEPDLLVSYTSESGSGPRSCLLMPNIDVRGLNNSDISWKIPSGRRAHANVVSAVTFVAAFASAIAIVWSSIFHSSFPLFKHAKQS